MSNLNQFHPLTRLFHSWGTKPIIRIVGGGGLLIALVLTLFLLFSVQRATAQTGTVPLVLRWSSTNAEPTSSVDWGDWDNDGDLDLVVGNSWYQPNWVYENNGDSLVPVWFSFEEYDTKSVAWGDWDADGDLDLAVGNWNQSNQVYANSGGNLEMAWSAPVTESTHSVAWGDWDNDGDLDLAVGNEGQPNRVYENSGDSLVPVWLSLETDDTKSVAWGDWDNDGDLDLAVGNDGQTNQVYTNSGGGLALDWSSSITDSTRSVAWGDWDNDGDLDLAVGNWGVQPNRVYANSGGDLELAWSSPETDYTESVAWGDWDADGDLDLAVGNNWGGRNWVYENDGGSLALIWSSSDTDETESVAWGDLDNDGDLDLAVGNSGQHNRVYAKGGGSLASSWLSSETDDTYSVAWGDWDEDGDLDLAVGNSGQPNRVYANSGGSLTLAWFSAEETDDTYSVAWGDWDNDGDLDLAVGNSGQPNRVYGNNGDSLTLAWSAPVTNSTYSVAWGDWDNDGDLDLAVGNDGEVNRVYENEGGTLVLDPDYGLGWQSTEANHTTSVAWGDWDGDGDFDLAIGNDGEVNLVYENEGGTLVLDPDYGLGWQSTEANYTTSVTWGDWDGDGDLDLATGNREGTNRVYENDGGSLTVAWISSEIEDTSSVAWGDWDGDGDLDLAVGNKWNRSNRVYANGGGTLALVWSSSETEATESVAWGDWDNDGDLDLAVGNGYGEPNRVYANSGGNLALAWSSLEIDDTTGVAWGDWDEDGDFDLAVGNWRDQPNRVYANSGGDLALACSLPMTGSITNLAWGDWDSDSDLDLALGNAGQPNRVYENDGDSLAPAWSSPETEDWTNDVAWGDWDGDDDLDLAVGSWEAPNRVYTNSGGNLELAWSAPMTDSTESVAWGDWDGDGDLDLAVGNHTQPNLVYANSDGSLVLTWISPVTDVTESVAWGDWDGDGDLDLAVGNRDQPNQVYENDGGTLVLDPGNGFGWESPETDDTYSVAWGDWDGDGDLDLAVGNNWGQRNRVYANSGGDLELAWSSPEIDNTYRVAWGDWDSDGDLDLAVGNYDQPNRLYRNMRRGTASLVNNPTYVMIPRPGATDDAHFFSTPYIIRASNIHIIYTLFDPEGDIVSRIFPEFSLNGGGQWFPATPATGTVTTSLAASPWPTGTTHTFVWNAEADLIKSDNIVFRIRARQGYSFSPIQWLAMDGKSPSFRVEAAPWFIKVIDDRGNPAAGVSVYANGQPITQTVTGLAVTDQAGLLNPGPLEVGTSLVALAQQTEQPTVRAVHDGWAYRTYLTNLTWDGNDQPQPFFVSEPGEQRLVVRRDSPLVLFSIVVSIEWDADGDYLQTIADAFRQASDYLYDVTDGQMAFGQVTIYDQAQYWADADYQISTKNTVRPYAFVGGLTSADEAHTIRVGRFWDGGSGNRGDWDQPDGYRTLIHELGHYALYLYDEYFIRQVDGSGHFIGEAPAACTSDSVRENSSDATNASIMFYQYNASELAGSDRWTEDCQNTEQQRINGQADWQTVLAHYGGADWTLNTPTSRGSVMAGPHEFPAHLLPFPEVVIHNGGATGGTARQLTVLDPQSQAVHNALVALYTLRDSVTIAIDQGLTDGRGKITVYGAAPGDTIRAATFDGAYAGAIAVGSETSYQLTLSQVGGGGFSAQDAGQVPYLSMTPQSDGDGLYLKVAGLEAGGLPLDAIVVPGEGGGSPQSTALAYSPAEEAHVGTVSLSGVGLGTGRVRVSGGSLPTSINSDYNLQWVDASEMNGLYSEDGNFQLHLPPGSLQADAYATVLPTGYVPGPLPGGKEVMGSAYDVRLSGAVTELEKAGVVKLHYHPRVMGVYTDTAIYYWSAADQEWQEVGGEPSEVDNALSTAVTRPGIYALMGELVGLLDGHSIYLPVILK